MLKNRLQQFIQNNLLRNRFAIQEKEKNYIVINNKKLINFASNDYLSLSAHPDIKKELIKGVNKYGLGSTASPLVCGYHQIHQQLEENFANFLKRDRAILFSSGYLANIGLMSALATRHTTIISDKNCHASLLDGIGLSRAKHLRYAHNDFIMAKKRLCQAKKNDLLVTESVFSMEGKISDVKSLATLAQQFKTLLVVDDAHGFGVLGKHGGGICDHLALDQNAVPYLVIPFGKALGSMGAVIAGSQSNIENILQLSRTYRYSTALPPALAQANDAALTLLQKEQWRRIKLRNIITFFNHQANLRKLSFFSDDITPIKSILIGDNQRLMKIQALFMQNGFFISAIRPPTVENKSARIRISLNCMLDEQNILNLLDLLEKTIHEK